MVSRRQVLTGIVLDERAEVTVLDLCRSCSVQRESIVALVEEGIITPVTVSERDYRFSGTSVSRATKAIRLQRDLGLNLAGVAVALDLLEQIENLRERLRVYE